MNTPSPLLSPLLGLPALLYEGIVRTRTVLYSRGVFTRHRLPCPVISIGNITLGGSGKTPLVIHTAKILRALGACPALLSRGYGRANSREVHLLAPRDNLLSPACNLGDEPALIRRSIPEIWMGISKDRYRVAGRILEQCPNPVFILDDGFQHLMLDRTLDVLVIDCSQPLERNQVFPRGTLREPLDSLCRAQAIVLNTGTSSSRPEGIEQVVRRFNLRAPILHCRQLIGYMAPFSSWMEEASAKCAAAPGQNAFLVAAIGNPERFRHDVESMGTVVRGFRSYRDHHRMKPEDWDTCAAEARLSGADFLLTTEKDAIKMTHAPGFPVMVAVQSVQLVEEGEFRNMLKQAVGESR